MTVTRIGTAILLGGGGILCLAFTLKADPPRTPAADAPGAKKDTIEGTGSEKRVPVAVARDRAKLMHEIYSATLDSMHHHFFRRERATLPARAMEDVFEEVDRRTDIKSRWIAVNTPAMSVNHEPGTEFEKEAAAEIAKGKAGFERVEKGYYYRATAIPLGVGCVGCHTRFGSSDDKKARFAGLVITIPVSDK